MRAGAEGIIAKVETSWEPFKAAVDRLGPGGIDQPTGSGWSAREMLAHIAFWDEAVEGAVLSLFREVPLPEGWAFGSGYVPESEWPVDYVHNAREAAWARGQTPEAVLERVQAAHAGLLRFLTTVTEDEARGRAAYFEEVAKHYRDHQPDLHGLLAKA